MDTVTNVGLNIIFFVGWFVSMLFHDAHQVLKLRIAAVHAEVKLQIMQAETYIWMTPWPLLIFCLGTFPEEIQYNSAQGRNFQ